MQIVHAGEKVGHGELLLGKQRTLDLDDLDDLEYLIFSSELLYRSFCTGKLSRLPLGELCSFLLLLLVKTLRIFHHAYTHTCSETRTYLPPDTDAEVERGCRSCTA
jgi:hypothetical protein